MRDVAIDAYLVYEMAESCRHSDDPPKTIQDVRAHLLERRFDPAMVEAMLGPVCQQYLDPRPLEGFSLLGAVA